MTHGSTLVLLITVAMMMAGFAARTVEAVAYDPKGLVYSVDFGDNWYLTNYDSEVNINTTDTVVFQFNSEHDAYISSVDACSGGSAMTTSACGSGSSCAVFKGSDYAAGTSRYVYCHVTGHCVIGMKVKINIINGTSSGATHAPKSGDATTARASLGALAAAGVFAALSCSLMLYR